MAKDQDVKIVSSTGVSSSSSLSGDADLAQRIQTAMEQAIQECLDEGITDPDVQRERMMAAREAELNA